MKEIELSQGFVALVDDEMFEELNQYKWSAAKSHNMYYAVRSGPRINGKQKTYRMHHLVLGYPPKGLMADHKDRNGLHNFRSNLRFVTNRQNQHNQRKVGTSEYPGIHWDKNSGKWKAQATINGIRRHLGLFISELAAFNAYRTAVESLGERVIDR